MKICSVKTGCGIKKELDQFRYIPSKDAIYYLCNECVTLKHKEYYRKNSSKLIAANKTRREADPAKAKREMSESAKKRYSLMKQKVFDKLGRECTCCGENNVAFLCVDHIENNGSKHRKEIKNVSFGIYNWLIKNDFPPGFQILCHNCNFSKGVNNGVCAHNLLDAFNDYPRGGSTAKLPEARDVLQDDDIVCSA